MENLDIGQLLKEHFFKQNKITEYNCFNIYKKANVIYDKLEKTLTKEQNNNLYWFRENIMEYYMEYIDVYTKYLVKNITKIYKI